MTIYEETLVMLERFAELDAGDVLRVSVDGDGVLTVETDAVRPRWFRSDGRSLEELLPQNDSRLPIAWKLREEPLAWKVLAWRPGRRLALQRLEPEAALVKGYTCKRMPARAAAIERAQVLNEGNLLRVPRLVRTNEELAAYEATWLPGAHPVVRASQAAHWSRIGRGLREFQRVVTTEGLPYHGPDSERELLDIAALRAHRVMGELPRGWSEVRKALDRVEVSEESEVAVHRDLHDGQLLVLQEQVGLLDLDGLCKGSPVLDAANLCVHLELRSRQGLDQADSHGAEVCGRAMLTSCFGETGIDLHSTLRFYQATTFARLALLYQLRPRWAHLVPDLVRLAERCLDELAVV